MVSEQRLQDQHYAVSVAAAEIGDISERADLTPHARQLMRICRDRLVKEIERIEAPFAVEPPAHHVRVHDDD